MSKHFRRFTVLTLAVVTAALTFGAATSQAKKLPVTYSVLSAAPALLSPGSSPAGANDWNCKPSKAHPNPVVLVHGSTANMGLNWGSLSPLLKNEGYCVYAFNYGETSISMGMIYALGPIRNSADELSAFVNKVRSSTGAAKVDIVGHSQGGMMPNYYIKFRGGASKVDKMVGLAPDNHGTDVMGLLKLVNSLSAVFPKLSKAIFSGIDKVAAGMTDQMYNSAFIKELNSVPDTVAGVNYTVIATKFDEVVTPYKSQFLSGGKNVKNITIQDKCWLDFSDHIAIAFDHVALREVLNALDPSHAKKASCSVVLPLIGG